MNRKKENALPLTPKMNQLIKPFIVFFCLTSLWACNNHPVFKKDYLQQEAINEQGLIPLDSMRVIIRDIYIAEAYSQRMQPKAQNGQYNFLPAYKQVVNQHKFTEEQFKKSFEYYLGYPEEMEKLYDLIIQELTQMQGGKVDENYEDKSLPPILRK